MGVYKVAFPPNKFIYLLFFSQQRNSETIFSSSPHYPVSNTTWQPPLPSQQHYQQPPLPSQQHYQQPPPSSQQQYHQSLQPSFIPRRSTESITAQFHHGKDAGRMVVQLAISYFFGEEVMGRNTAGSLNHSKMQRIKSIVISKFAQKRSLKDQ